MQRTFKQDFSFLIENEDDSRFALLKNGLYYLFIIIIITSQTFLEAGRDRVQDAAVSEFEKECLNFILSRGRPCGVISLKDLSIMAAFIYTLRRN